MIFEKIPEGRAKELYDKLYTLDFDAAGLRTELESGKYDTDAVNLAAIEYVDDCGMNFDHWSVDWDEYYPGETVPGHESSHMTEAIGLLLEFGLDPNRIYREEHEGRRTDEYNIMEQLQLIFNGYQAADCLYLLLSHGGNPNLKVCGLPLNADPDGDIIYDTENREDVADGMYEAKLHYWFVLTGFRAELADTEFSLEPEKGFDLSELKKHRNYYAGAIRSDRTKAGWDLCIFDRHTNWEVARL